MTSVLVRRAGALGDVLLTTPIVAQLRETLGKEALIDVETGCPQAYDGNPHVSRVNPNDGVPYDHVIDLNMVYENDPQRHIVDAYALHAFGVTEINKRVVFGIESPPPKELIRTSNVVSIHAARSWPSRTIPERTWDETVVGLVSAGYKVQFIGAGNDYHGPEIRGTDGTILSLVGQLPLRETANHIAASVCFIASDSSLLHLAGATNTPIVGIFTSVRANYRLPFREGVLGLKCKAIWPQGLSCYGCLGEERGRTSLQCKFNSNACVQIIRADDIVQAVKDLTF